MVRPEDAIAAVTREEFDQLVDEKIDILKVQFHNQMDLASKGYDNLVHDVINLNKKLDEVKTDIDLLKAMKAATGGKSIKTKDAVHLKPAAWTGPRYLPWRRFASSVKNWAAAVHEDLRTLMAVVEGFWHRPRNE